MEQEVKQPIEENKNLNSYKGKDQDIRVILLIEPHKVLVILGVNTEVHLYWEGKHLVAPCNIRKRVDGVI